MSDKIIPLAEQERATPSDSDAENLSDDEEEEEGGEEETVMEQCADEDATNNHGNHVNVIIHTN